jgi:TIR domain
VITNARVRSDYKIFLSYSHLDGEDACEHFETSTGHWKPWRDVARLAGGDDWRVKAEPVIRSCDAVIALMTPGAVESEAVLWEWETALHYGKCLIPAVIKPCAIPDFLSPNIIRLDLTGEEYQYAPQRITRDIQQRWIDVDGAFDELQADLRQQPHDDAMHFLLDYLDRDLSRRPSSTMPPEIFDIWFGIVRDLMNAYPNVDELIDRLVEGNYRDSSDGEEQSIFKAQYDHYFKAPCLRLRSELPGVRLPVVVVAMTDAQAKQLDSGAVFGDEDLTLKQEFTEVRNLLEPQDWLRSYGTESEEWRPFGNAETVKELIRVALAGVISRGEAQDRIVPRYPDLMRPEVGSDLQELSRTAIVVVDYVSTRYPPLHERFRRSGLDVSQGTPTILVGLNDDMFKHTEVEMRRFVRLHFDWLYDRGRKKDDPHWDQVSDRTRFLRFLGNQIPHVLRNSNRSRGVSILGPRLTLDRSMA